MVQKQTRVKYEYLFPFLDYSKKEIHLTEISKELCEVHSTVRRYLNEFEEDGILNKRNVGRLTFYSLNLRNPSIIDILTITELIKSIKKTKSDLILNEINSFIKENLNNSLVLIFGSATTNSKKANDIDILIINKKEVSFKKLENLINKKIQVIQMTSLNKLNNALKEEIKKNHLLLNGGEKLVKWLI